MLTAARRQEARRGSEDIVSHRWRGRSIACGATRVQQFEQRRRVARKQATRAGQADGMNRRLRQVQRLIATAMKTRFTCRRRTGAPLLGSASPRRRRCSVAVPHVNSAMTTRTPCAISFLGAPRAHPPLRPFGSHARARQQQADVVCCWVFSSCWARRRWRGLRLNCLS